MSTELTKVIEEIGEGFEAFSKSTGEKVESLAERLEKLEASNDRPKGGGGSPKDRELKAATERFYRTGDRSGLAPYQSGFDEKSMSISDDAAGGFSHVPELADSILAAVGEVSPLFNAAGKEQTDKNEWRQIYTIAGPSAGRSAEGGTRNASTDPEMARVDIPLFDLYALISVRNELLDSSGFDIARYVEEEAQRQFEASLETETADGLGSGSAQASGILPAATSTAADEDSPRRAFGVYQLKDLGDVSVSPISTFNYNSLVSLAQSLPVRYRRNAAFYASTSAVEDMRQFTDSQSRPVWLDAQGGISGRPQSILGYPVIECPVLPAVAAGAKCVLFGDMSRAYTWVRHSRGMTVLRDPYSVKGSTSFYLSLQIGGGPADSRSLKVLRVS